MRRQKLGLCCSVIAFGSLVSGGTAFSQDLFKQLEQKVRSELKLDEPTNPTPNSQPPANGSSEELPAPQGQPAAPPAAKSPSVASPLSILEPPTSKSPTFAAPSPLQPSADAPVGQSTYLGLDVEPVIGGGIGVRVVGVTQTSPAWRAGFRVGDVVQAIDGFAIANMDTMADRLGRKRAGEPIKVLVNRGGKNTELTAVLQDAALGERLHGFVPQAGAAVVEGAPAYLGLSVSDLSSAFRLQFGISAFRGAAVTNVVKGSPADTARIQPGDVVVAINNQPVDGSQDLVNWMTIARPGEVAVFRVLRGQQPRDVEVIVGIDPKFGSTTGSTIPRGLGYQVGGNIIPPMNTPVVVSGTNEELRIEVQQLRDELQATREQMQLLQKRVEQLIEQRK